MDTVITISREVLVGGLCPVMDDYELGNYGVLGRPGIVIYRRYFSFPGV